MAEIMVGDTVRLKSGGPLMTVVGIDSYGSMGTGLLCQWFDGNRREEKVFIPGTVEISEKKTGPTRLERS